ncbi:o-succinylbenzoate synthase [Rubrobacter tropicus]|uniref:o-succinylbenzoate synthase n=1 Tax=Rubrobacter tropicus TaxID=2653851 RepID=A0A6G8QBY2_9ACTN|nr:o-succinylbenzoate synthase [Rubrobacter tropicus]QIN84014.1 o-succinylbenzoate synthase [Rubrobacter tropicus]
MKPASLDLFRYALPFSEPVALKRSTLINRDGILVRLAAEDGSVGWGETSPLPGFSPEPLETVIGQLYDFASWAPGGKLPGDWLDHANRAPSVRFGLETATWNLSASLSGTDSPEPMKDPSREVVSVSGLISGTSAELVEEADRMRAEGYRAVKLKVGGRGVAGNVRMVLEVAEALGDGVSLRLDANRAWGFGEAVEFGLGVSGVRIEYVEEPLAEQGRLGELAGIWGLPVALDETLVGMGPEDLGDHGYARAVVLKPMLLGGISRCLRFAEEAEALGMKAVVSSSYESGVGTGALVALAAAIGGEPVGLDTYRRLAEDVIVVPLDLPAPVVDVRRAVAAARRVDLRKVVPVPG